MMPSKKHKGFGGFSTAREFMNASSSDIENWPRTDDAGEGTRQGGAAVLSARNNSESNSISIHGGFSTAGAIMKEAPTNPDAGAGNQQAKLGKTESTNDSNQSKHTIHLTVRGIKYHSESIHSLDSITLHREPHNEFDTNAISVKNAEGGIVGHIAKEQAAVLAQPMDANVIDLGNISLVEQKDATLLISAKVNLRDETRNEEFKTVLPKILGIQSNVKEYKKYDMITNEAVHQLAAGIVEQDAKTASTCHMNILEATHLPWKTNQDGSLATWPPSQAILDKLGYGQVDDEDWWQENTGLKPPTQWNVTGALDLLPTVPIPAHQKARASDVLDDAVHGVTNVWSDQTLQDIRTLMHSPKFWCYRGADAFIRAFGGPYVLGQQEGKLKLIMGNAHIKLTETICRGHNAVYELVHLTKPPEPGFNTIIFGLNLRRSGFHYHCDTIASLKAKNAPLVSRQPVVTTVFYEKPEEDNGKELVLWKPLLNFKPRDDSLYMAARGIQTLHGMVHVQRAGLQSGAQHGIFHTPVFDNGSNEPGSDPRRGYRVAITARITHENSDQLLKRYLGNDHYSVVLGPNGNKTLCLSSND